METLGRIKHSQIGYQESLQINQKIFFLSQVKKKKKTFYEWRSYLFMQFAPNKLKKIEGKTHLKETSQPCLYFGNFCGGGGRIGNLYINNNKNKWIGFSSKGVGIEGFDKERKNPNK